MGRGHVRVRTQLVRAHNALGQARQILVQGDSQIFRLFPDLFGQGFGAFQGFGLHATQRFGIEIHIGQRAEQGPDREIVGFHIHNALGAGLQGQGGQTAQKPDQLILAGRHIGALAAHPGHGTAGSLGGLLTLCKTWVSPFPPLRRNVCCTKSLTGSEYCDCGHSLS